jgi:Ni,Fe-hydrogenase III small subunit/ferredoxin
LRNGVVTSGWPRRGDEYFDGFPAAVDVARGAARPSTGVPGDAQGGHRLEAVCPAGAITVSDGPDAGEATAGDDLAGRVRLDRGRCILCGRCVAQRPDLFVWAPGSDVARRRRDELVVGDVAETEENLDLLRSELARRVRALRRSVHIRHVDAGSDGSDEWEIQALANPVYDMHRLGIFFTASPRHADILLVTGIGAAGMVAPLQRTREAMPDPVVVIAAGVEAVSGGVLHASYSGRGGIGEILDVDIWVPGSPATPFALMHAILLALGRLSASRPQAVRARGAVATVEGSG